jgi:hypothetical protein
MQEATIQRHDRLIRENETRIIDALHRSSSAREVAGELGLPVDVIRHVKRQLPASMMRATEKKPVLYDEDAIAAAFRRVQEKLGDAPLTEKSYEANRKQGEPSLSRICQLYGRWNVALKTMGLPVVKVSTGREQFTVDDCLTAVAACAADLGEAPSYPQYGAWARTRADAPSGQTVRNRLGRWLEALAAVGL